MSVVFLASYPSSKPFNIPFSIGIYFVYLLCICGVGYWTYRTKDFFCEPITYDYYNETCNPFKITNNTEIQILDFPVMNMVQGLSKDYQYEGGTFTCLSIDNYRIVQHASRYIEVFYNAKCFFNDEENTPFNLTANTATNQLDFGWYSDLPGANCPSSPYFLESMVFDSYDTGVIALGENIGSSCTLQVAFDSEGKPKLNHRGDLIPSNTTSYTLEQYTNLQRAQAKKLLSSLSPMTFKVGYACSHCTPNSRLGFALALVTAITSVGTMLYHRIISFAAYFYQLSLGPMRDHLELGKLHSGYSELRGEREHGGNAHVV